MNSLAIGKGIFLYFKHLDQVSVMGTRRGFYDLCHKVIVTQNIGNWGEFVFTFEIILTISGPTRKQF